MAPLQHTGTTWTTVGTCVLDATLSGGDFPAPGTLTLSSLFSVLPGASGAASLRLTRVSDGVVVLTVSSNATLPSFEDAAAGGTDASAYYVQVRTAGPADVMVIWYAGAVFEV